MYFIIVFYMVLFRHTDWRLEDFNSETLYLKITCAVLDVNVCVCCLSVCVVSVCVCVCVCCSFIASAGASATTQRRGSTWRRRTGQTSRMPAPCGWKVGKQPASAQHSTAQHNTAQYNTAKHTTIPHSTTYHFTLHYH